MICVGVETGEHILFECNRYVEERKQWIGIIKRPNGSMCEYEVIKEYFWLFSSI